MTDEVYVDDPRLESAPHTSEEESEAVNQLTAEEPEAEEPEGEEPEPETDEEEPEDAEEPGEDAAAKPKRKNTAQERIAELTRLRREAERERDAYRQTLEKLAQGQQQPKPQEQAKAPRRYDYDSDEEYDAAMATYTERRAAEIARQQVEAFQRQQQQTEAERQQQAALQEVQKAETDFASEHDDYFDAVDSLSALDANAVRQVLPADSAPKVLYHLAQHPDKAQEIANLPTTEQAVYALGRIEASLAQKPRRETTKAPNPVKTVKGRGKTSKKWRDDMSMAQVEKQLGYK